MCGSLINIYSYWVLLFCIKFQVSVWWTSTFFWQWDPPRIEAFKNGYSVYGQCWWESQCISGNLIHFICSLKSIFCFLTGASTISILLPTEFFFLEQTSWNSLKVTKDHVVPFLLTCIFHCCLCCANLFLQLFFNCSILIIRIMRLSFCVSVFHNTEGWSRLSWRKAYGTCIYYCFFSGNQSLFIYFK